MAAVFAPRTVTELEEAISGAAAAVSPLEVAGSGSMRGAGRPVEAAAMLDLSGFAGVESYEPEELVLTAGAATPLPEIEALLAQRGQALAFEPPHLSRLMGSAGQGTLGGIIACNLSGPRRIKAGAARDHFLGFTAVSGRGEAFRSGGRVMKNVTGYDLPKMMAGSWGTLAAMASLTVKVLPAAETEATLVLAGPSASEASDAMSQAMGSAAEVSGAAHLPRDIAAASSVAAVAAAGRDLTLFRLEGIAPSVAYRADRLARLLAPHGDIAPVEAAASRALWREVRDVSFLADRPELPLWRVSVPPMHGWRVLAALAEVEGARGFLDWAGGLVWLEVPALPHGFAELVRGSFAGVGGHAMLLRAPQAMRASLPVFEPQPRPLAELTRRLKAAFDPCGILNRGRMYP